MREVDAVDTVASTMRSDSRGTEKGEGPAGPSPQVESQREEVSLLIAFTYTGGKPCLDFDAHPTDSPSPRFNPSGKSESPFASPDMLSAEHDAVDRV